MKLPAWHVAYTLFRAGDGLTHALIPLLPMLWYDLPVWTVPALAAAMNVVTVPATFAWGALMDRHRGRGRRRLAIAGFAVSAVCLAIIAIQPTMAVFVIAAVAFTAFGVATAPAASVLLLETVPSAQWAAATGRLAQRTGYSYLAGIMVTMVAGLAEILDIAVMFVAAASLSLAAAFVAQRTIAPATGPADRATPTMATVRAGQRRFERTVFFPTRLRFPPTFKGIRLADGHPRRFLIAMFLIFAGSSLFFSGYPGLLRELGLSVGIILLAQMPSNFTTALTHPWAGRWGAEHGELRGTHYGAMIRLASLPALAILVAWWPPGALWLLLGLHALIGISFALLQVNGSCLMAKVHRGGRGQGVGNFHATVAVGGLAGSVVAALLLAWTSYLAVIVAVTVCLGLGTLVIMSLLGSDQFDVRNG